MVLIAVEVVPAGSKSPAAVVEYISKGERQYFGTAVPMSTMTSSLRERAGGSAFMPKLIELFGPAWTFYAEQLPPCFA